MLKIAHISIIFILTAVIFAGCAGTPNTPSPTPTVTAMPDQTSGLPLNLSSANQSGGVTPTPIVSPIRTTKVPVKTSYIISYVEFKVYEDKVVIEYLSGLGKLNVSSSNMGGTGEYSGYLAEPGNNITLGFNLSMPRELPEQDASISVYQLTDSGMLYGETKYYPRTGDIKES